VIGDGVTQRFSRFFSHFPKRKREIGTAKKCTAATGEFVLGKKQKLKRYVLKHGTLKEYLTV
jgi:hypothetical protein